MAKKLTRTIKSNIVTVLCLNTETAEPFNETINVPVEHKTEERIIKYARKVLDTDTVKAVSIAHVEQTSDLYEISEEDFLKYATKKTTENG